MKKTYLIAGISLLALFSCGQKSKKNPPLLELQLQIMDSGFTPAQARETMDILKKRLTSSGSMTSTASLGKEGNTIILQTDSLQPDFIKRRLLQPMKLEFFECYTIVELAPMLIEAAAEIDKPVTQKNARVNFDELRKQQISEKFFLALMNPQEPTTDAKTGATVIMPNLGNVKERDTPLFNKLIPIAKNYLPVGCKLMYGKRETSATGLEGFFGLYAVKDDDSKMEVNKYLEKVEAVGDETGRPSIRLQFNVPGTKNWERMTQRCINKNIAIVIDGQVFSAPLVMGAIAGGISEIAGNFKASDAKEITAMMSAGDLPLHLQLVGMRQVTAK